MNEYQTSIDNALNQAVATAEDYLNNAYRILKKNHYEGWEVKEAVELAKVMASDFHTSIMCLKLQEIRDSIHALKKD